MDCNDIKAILSALVDGQIDAGVRHDAERHLVDCAECRRLLSHAEDVDAALQRSLDEETTDAALPVGFAEFVLGQTVNSAQMRAARWTSSLGWLAAAACLMLALGIWVMDRRTMVWPGSEFVENPALDDDSSSRSTQVANRAYSPGNELRSYVRETSLAAGTSPASSRVDEPPAMHSLISNDDSAALYTAAMLLDELRQADTHSFSAADRIRQVALYEQLLPQLRSARERVTSEHRASVFAAESVFLRITEGPLTLGDLDELRGTVASLRLAETMESLGNDSAQASSL